MAAAIVISIGAGVAYQFGHLRFTAESRESYITSISNRVAGILRPGLGDHVNCAVFRKYPKDPPSVQQVVADVAPAYRDLVSLVQTKVPDNFRPFMAHECEYHGRRFVHLTFRNDSRTLSMVIARKGDGESFAKSELLPALVQWDTPIYHAGVQRFAISAFETSSHLVYLISDLPEQKNTDITAALAPEVKAFLEHLQG